MTKYFISLVSKRPFLVLGDIKPLEERFDNFYEINKNKVNNENFIELLYLAEVKDHLKYKDIKKLKNQFIRKGLELKVYRLNEI